MLEHLDEQALAELNRHLHALIPSASLAEPVGNRAADLRGKRYGRLVALAPTSERTKGGIVWLCRCDCGSYTTAATGNLRRNKEHTRSCGCLWREAISLAPGEAAFNDLLYNYQRKARERGYEWALTASEFHELTRQPCFYCGQEPSAVRQPPQYSTAYVYSGVDRVDNAKGYTPDNAVPCCETCNRAKLAMTASEFLSWAQRLAEHQEWCNE